MEAWLTALRGRGRVSVSESGEIVRNGTFETFETGDQGTRATKASGGGRVVFDLAV